MFYIIYINIIGTYLLNYKKRKKLFIKIYPKSFNGLLVENIIQYFYLYLLYSSKHIRYYLFRTKLLNNLYSKLKVG